MTGNSLWTTIKIDIARVLLPQAALALWRRVRHGPAPVWAGQPIAPAFAAQIIADGGIDVTNLLGAAKPTHDSHAEMRKWLRLVMAGAAPGHSSQAARHGLVPTRPFYDRRVVELALAIPQDLEVKNGRNRYLACAALKDVYPPEFQTRWRKNDDQIPDFQRMASSIKPRLLTEIARMERSEKLAYYVDFGKIRRLLAARGPDDHNSGWEQETQRAFVGFFIARYLEWFWRDNR